MDFARGNFRVRGDTIDIYPSGMEIAYRIEFFGDEVDRILKIDPLTGEVLDYPKEIHIFPTSHYVTPEEKMRVAIDGIRKEYEQRVKYFDDHNKYLEAQRLTNEISTIWR